MPHDPFAGLPDLATLDPKTKEAPKTRLTSATSLRSQHQSMVQDDRTRSAQRAKVQAMFDGEPPYDQKLLLLAGQGSRCNINFRHATRYLNLGVAGFVDLANSVDTLIDVKLPVITDADERALHESNLNKEITHAIRSWSGFYPTYLRLVTTFISHGASVAYFPNKSDFRFSATGFDKFKIPQATKASASAIDIGTMVDDMSVVDLYQFIENESVAKATGWNPDLVKKAIISKVNTTEDVSVDEDWEGVQRKIKNGDFSSGKTSAYVKVIFGWVREFNGAISLFATTESGKEDEFLCKQIAIYPNVTEAYHTFTYGVGTNGTFHSVEGMGKTIFPYIQVLNRLMCQMVDGTMLASSMIVQPSSIEELRQFQIQNLGGITAISPHVRFQEKGFSVNLAQSTIPAIQSMEAGLSENLDFYSARGAAAGSPYRSKMQVEAELEAATRLTSATLSLFYSSWTPLLREVTRRIINGPKSDPAVAEFYKRLAASGTPAEVAKLVDIATVSAVRAIGAGNAANRTAAYQRLWERLGPALPEDGRARLVYDMTANEVGYEAAEAYARKPESPRPVVDTKIAELENAAMLGGSPVSVQDRELHGYHLEVHLAALKELTDGIEVGQIDPLQVLDGMELLYNHSFEHLQLIAPDPMSAEIVRNAKPILQNAEEQILNFRRKQEAELQKQAEAGDQNAQGQAEQLKLQILQTKGDIEIKKKELDLAVAQAKAQSEQRREEAKLAAIDAQSTLKALQSRAL